ncbi:MAG: F0F1 ATP synthase subunit epsilon [Paludibacteraceae bacterium]|nr:F0F1 ATP synthase subunit epsilon [Paludibacteraceae bacterium]
MNVSVLSASKSLFQGTATSVAFPGAQSAFTVLENHAPIISLLTKGIIVITNEKGEETRIDIASGFVEIHANEVTACVELV